MSNQSQNKSKYAFDFDILAVISTTGMILWMITDFYGGMIGYLMYYQIIILPIILIYIISFIQTIIVISRGYIKNNTIKIISHGIVIAAIIFLSLYHAEIFKSKKILEAISDDKFGESTLTFRENGSVEYQSEAFGFIQEKSTGNYIFKRDTIIFIKNPYRDNLIPDTLLLDKNANAIFTTKDTSTGKFITEKGYLNYFEIENNAK